MEKLKEFLKTKKGKITIAVISVLLVIGCIGGGYVYNENVKKTKALDAMKITFNKDFKLEEVEYGSTNEVKDLVKVENGEVKEYPVIDTTKVGEQTLKFVVSKGKYSKEIEQKIKVIDTKAPEITFEADSKELTVGEEFDIKSNLTSVKDPVDGDIALVEDAKIINEKATKEYKELTKVDIKDDTKIADKTMNEFIVVNGEKEESDKTLLLKNCYYIDGTVDVATAGDYKIKVVAVDKNGVKSEKEFTVTVKEKVVEPTAPVNGGNGGTYSTNYSNGGNSGGSSASATAPQGKGALVNYALSMVGQNNWNCADFVTHVLTQTGYLPQGTSNYNYGNFSYINVTDLQPGDIVSMPSHVYMITSYPEIVNTDKGTFYKWTRVEGGAGADRIIRTDTFTYNSEYSSINGFSFLRF